MGERARTRRGGFTLVEIMVAIAIVALLATLMMPNITDQAARANVVEGVAVAQFVRDAVQASYGATHAMPADNAAAGVPPADRIVGRTVSGVTVKGGAIVVQFGNQASHALAGHKLTLRPAIVAGYPQVPIAWICGGAPVPAGMTAQGSDESDLPLAWQPVNCRGRAPSHP